MKKPEYYNHVWSYDSLTKKLENDRLYYQIIIHSRIRKIVYSTFTGKSAKFRQVITKARFFAT